MGCGAHIAVYGAPLNRSRITAHFRRGTVENLPEADRQFSRALGHFKRAIIEHADEGLFLAAYVARALTSVARRRHHAFHPPYLFARITAHVQPKVLNQVQSILMLTLYWLWGACWYRYVVNLCHSVHDEDILNDVTRPEYVLLRSRLQDTIATFKAHSNVAGLAMILRHMPAYVIYCG